MHEALTIDFNKPVPLFPLPNLVLLPHATVSLHIFEPRYRAMTCDALDSHGLIAMAMFDGDRWRTEYDGKPPLRPHVCVGYITRHRRHDDGNYDLLVQGICRARIDREVDHESYRKAIVRPTEPNPPMEIDLGDMRKRVERLLDCDTLKHLAAASAIRNYMSDELPTAALIDLAALTCSGNDEERYAALAECDTERRGRWLEKMLAGIRDTLRKADRIHPPAVDGHMHVN
jgi:Lon protease-like protein